MINMFKVPQAIGNRLLIEVVVDEALTVKSDVLYIPDTNNANERALKSTSYGEITQMGNAAMENMLLTKEEDEISPGKIILFLQNAGVSYKHEDEGKIYRIIGRGDIMAVIGENIDE